jgi:hypothetical protein
MKYLVVLLLGIVCGFFFTGCAAHKPEVRRIGVFYNYMNEHTIDPLVVAEITLPNGSTEEDAWEAYKDWVADQIPSGSAGWFILERGE